MARLAVTSYERVNLRRSFTQHSHGYAGRIYDITQAKALTVCRLFIRIVPVSMSVRRGITSR